MHHPADGAAPSEPETTQPAQPLYAGVPIGTGHLLEFAGEHLQSLGRIAHGYAQRAKADPSTQARACRAIAELASSGHGVFLLAQLAGQQGDHTTFKGIVGCHAAFMDGLKLATHEVMRAGRLAGRAAA